MFLPFAAFNDLGANTLQNVAGDVGQSAASLIGNPILLVGGIVLIVSALLVFFLLKKIIANTIAGLIVWAIVHFLFGVQLPLLPTLALTVVFGLGGIGSMLILRFFELI